MFKIIVLFLFVLIGILGLDSAGVLALKWVVPNSSKVRPLSRDKLYKQQLFSNLNTLRFTSLKGKSFKVTDFKGKVIIINFWASWCDPCKEEFPAILKLVNRFKGKVVLIAISNDFNKARAISFLKGFQKNYPKSFPFVYGVWDKNSKITQGIFKIIKLPETLILDKNLKIVTKIIGSKKWLNGKAQNLIKSAL
ncbi:MAG: TlpA family protein disulfide reductase [Bdellovibrionaceae bacterium]|nr:TlpA family protein disulfide reductase [Pseudobdellovibrionaceae bacterium]